MVVPSRRIGWMVQVKTSVKEEEAARVLDNDFGCTPTNKVECSDCRKY